MTDQNLMAYSKLEFVEDWQLEAIQLTDPSWRIRNSKYLISAAPETERMEPLVVEYPKLKWLETDYLTSGLIKAVSVNLMQFLEPKIHAEFIPIHGLHKGVPYTKKRFYVMHLLDRIAAMDLQKSIYTEYPPDAGGGINRVESIVLDPEKIGSSPAFVLEELTFTCFRNDLCKDIQDAGFRGIEFCPIDEYQNVGPLSLC